MKEAGNSRLRRAAPLCKFGGGQPAGASRTSASVAAPRDPRALVSKCLLSLRATAEGSDSYSRSDGGVTSALLYLGATVRHHSPLRGGAA